MNRCVVCDKVIEESFVSLFVEECMVCHECKVMFKVRNKRFVVNGVKGMILYYYDDFFRDLLFRYKGSYDYVLKDVFLNDRVNELRREYRGRAIVIAPSTKNSEAKRGFCHLEGIFKSLNLKIIKCFEKNEGWKQSDKKWGDRKGIQNVIKIDKSLLNGVKKVLIVDDVLTSGSTIKAMISQIPSCIDKKVLVLASNCRFLANEIV